jgi:hypothetical protein
LLFTTPRVRWIFCCESHALLNTIDIARMHMNYRSSNDQQWQLDGNYFDSGSQDCTAESTCCCDDADGFSPP